jgi:predicted ester cyclase
MPTRRSFLRSAFGVGAGCALALQVARPAGAQTPGRTTLSGVSSERLERNKAAVLRYKQSQGTDKADDVAREVLAPRYRRLRAGLHHLASNARGQGFPSPGSNLRDAIPDREDMIEDIVADGDRVGLLFRITGTQQGNLYGIAPTGKRIDVFEAGLFRLADGQITEAWFMADEAGLLRQLGGRLPARKDGKLIAPPVTGDGEDGDALVARLVEEARRSNESRNKIVIARSKSSAPPERPSDFVQRRRGFEHLRRYGQAHGVSEQTPSYALPDRHDRVDDLLGEGNKVWMRFRLAGTQTRSLYGLPPTNRQVEVPELGIMRFAGGDWQEGWYFGDELGLLLQLGAPNLLVS